MSFLKKKLNIYYFRSYFMFIIIFNLLYILVKLVKIIYLNLIFFFNLFFRSNPIN